MANHSLGKRLQWKKKNTTHKHSTLSTVTVCDIQKEYYNYFYFFYWKAPSQTQNLPSVGIVLYRCYWSVCLWCAYDVQAQCVMLNTSLWVYWFTDEQKWYTHSCVWSFEDFFCSCSPWIGERWEQAGLLAVALVDEGDEMMQKEQRETGQQRRVGWMEPECTGLRSLSPSLKVPEVGGPDLHLCKLDGVLMTLPVEPVYTLEKKTQIKWSWHIHTILLQGTQSKM